MTVKSFGSVADYTLNHEGGIIGAACALCQIPRVLATRANLVRPGFFEPVKSVKSCITVKVCEIPAAGRLLAGW